MTCDTALECLRSAQHGRFLSGRPIVGNAALFRRPLFHGVRFFFFCNGFVGVGVISIELMLAAISAVAGGGLDGGCGAVDRGESISIRISSSLMKFEGKGTKTSVSCGSTSFGVSSHLLLRNLPTMRANWK